MAEKISRRDFLKKSAVGLAGLTIVPSAVLGKSVGQTSPSDKLNIAAVGIGGVCKSNLNAVKSENIVALCDVDWEYAKGSFETYPNAKRFWDWREMYEKIGKEIDAVIVATPDHSHAVAAAHAMMLGKGVYVQKPLTHTVYESRLLTKLADKYKVASQMGNQGASGEGVRQICDWMWNGEIGEVTHVEAFTDRPSWPQGLDTPREAMEIPETLRWDLFIGPAKNRPYNRAYHPWDWRGWWDYGTGALGDMACHILHPVFKALQLQYPTLVEGSSTPLKPDSAPLAEHVRLVYPARGRKGNMALPEVTIDWYDGGLKPNRPKGMPDGVNMNVEGGCVIFHGTKDTLICGCYGRRPYLLSGRTPQVPSQNRVITISHEMDWVRACKESAANRVLTASDFSEAGPFNEMVVMGVLAVRLQALNKVLQWDGLNMKFTNINENDRISTAREVITVVDGHPTVTRSRESIPATEFAAELIRHNYQNGFSLPPMP